MPSRCRSRITFKFAEAREHGQRELRHRLRCRQEVTAHNRGSRTEKHEQDLGFPIRPEFTCNIDQRSREDFGCIEEGVSLGGVSTPGIAAA